MLLLEQELLTLPKHVSSPMVLSVGFVLSNLLLPSGVGNTPKIAIFRMCCGENGTVKFLETLADNVFRHNYSMMQILKKNEHKLLQSDF
jgi:hypothetical protein